MAELFKIRKQVEWRKWKVEIKKLDKNRTKIAKKKISKLNGE